MNRASDVHITSCSVYCRRVHGSSVQQSESCQELPCLDVLFNEDTTMDIALKKLDLIQRLMQVWDEATLQRIAKTIEEAVPDEEG